MSRWDVKLRVHLRQVVGMSDSGPSLSRFSPHCYTAERRDGGSRNRCGGSVLQAVKVLILMWDLSLVQSITITCPVPQAITLSVPIFFLTKGTNRHFYRDLKHLNKNQFCILCNINRTSHLNTFTLCPYTWYGWIFTSDLSVPGPAGYEAGSIRVHHWYDSLLRST